MGPLIIPDSTTDHANSNVWIVDTKEIFLLREVTGVKQALVQQIFATVKGDYLADICNQTTNSINDTMEEVLTHLQDNYGQLMPHELLEREDIVKKTTYNPQDPIATMFSAVKELLEFSNITGMLYTQIQAVNISYVIVHRTGNFGPEICEWNRMPTIQKTWVRFKQFFLTAHQEL